jgi:TetR/AcrR family transcriptional regulator, cholesterol catabolism regulator
VAKETGARQRGRKKTPSGKPVSNGQKPGRRDEEVLAAAVKVFYERGYSDATVQDVADELGILKGSLYHYIKTKEDLLFKVFEEVHTDVEVILEGVLAEQDLEPIERLGLYVRRQVEYNVNNLKQISIYYHDMDRLSEQRLSLVQRRGRTHTQFVIDLIVEAQARKQADPSIDPKLLASCVFGTLIWVYRWYRPGRMSRSAVAEVCEKYALGGVTGTVPL